MIFLGFALPEGLVFDGGEFGDDGYFGNKINGAGNAEQFKIHYHQDEGEYTVAPVKDGEQTHEILPAAFEKGITGKGVDA